MDLYDKTLKNSVEHHLISDAPISILFSGGLDSTLMTRLALEFNKIFEKGKFNDRRVDSALSFSNTLSSPIHPDSQEGGITNVLESLRPRMAGGGIMDYTNGGHAVGPGTATSDSIPAFLSDGEFVMTNKAVKGFGGGNREQGAQKLYNMMKKAEDSA